MRQVVLATIDKLRPAILLTPPAKRGRLRNWTVVPITTTVFGISTEIQVGPEEGCDADCVASCDNVTTIPRSDVSETVGLFYREDELKSALLFALGFDTTS